MELGGLFGSLLAGRISDALIARNPKGGNVGKRVQVSFPNQQIEAAGMDHIVLTLHCLNKTMQLVAGVWACSIIFSAKQPSLTLSCFWAAWLSLSNHCTSCSDSSFTLPAMPGGHWIHSGRCSYAASLLVYTSQPAMAAVGHGVHDWLLPVRPTDADWPVWS